jgi:hemerythrin-like domain-containing protein
MIHTVNLHLIGQQHIPNFSDPLGLLAHCHTRIEGHLRALEYAGEVLRRPDAEQLPDALNQIALACAHFAVPGVKHTQDEEISLFPRLREHGGREAEDALDAAEELEIQHRVAERLHAELDALAERIPRDGVVEAKTVDRFNDIVSILAAIYRPHIRVENSIVFLVAARVLPVDVIQAIGNEMRARRQGILKSLPASQMLDRNDI